MSEFRVGLIAEGKTDLIVMKAIIRQVFFGKSFIFTEISSTEAELLGREPKPEGFGWKSVFLTCRHLAERIQMQQAAGHSFDLLVIQLDADITLSSYETANIGMVGDAHDRLPSYDESQNIAENCEHLKQIVLTDWIGQENRIPGLVWCIPYINIDLWAAYCLYENDRGILAESMSNDELVRLLLQKGKDEGRLLSRKQGRIKKRSSVYKGAMQKLSVALWQNMTQNFVQAKAFDLELCNSMV